MDEWTRKGAGTSMTRWWTFVGERFHPASHFAMIVLYCAAHWTFQSASYAPPANDLLPPLGRAGEPLLGGVVLFVGVTAFFMKLRFYDEIKDFELDSRLNPTRPLVRGLVDHTDLYRGIAVCIAVELLTFGLAGWGPLVAMALAVAWSLLMYKEFFVPALIRPRLTTYAVSHTVVCTFLSLAVLCALAHAPPWDLARPQYLFCLGSWCVFNVFEFGRKTFVTGEEREHVDSYSKVFGRFGAVALVLVMGGIFLGLAVILHLRLSFLGLSGGVLALLLAVGLLYSALDRAPYGAIYRAMSSAYIVLVYLGFVVFYADALARPAAG